jgi:hypothetical protein
MICSFNVWKTCVAALQCAFMDTWSCPNMFHMLVNEPERATLAEAIHFLKLSFAKPAQSKTSHRIEFVLAKALLRPKREGCARVRGKATILAPKSGEAWTGQGTRTLEVEQLSSLRTAGDWDRRNRVRMDSNGSGNKNRRPRASVPQPS